MWGTCPSWAPAQSGGVVFKAASPNAHRCALESPIFRVTCLVGPGQFTKLEHEFLTQIVSAATRQRPRSISATVAARRRPTCRVIGAFSDNSYACWSTRTDNPGTLDTLPSAPPSLRSPAPNTADARGGMHCRRQQMPVALATKRWLAPAAKICGARSTPRSCEEAVRQLTISRATVTPGRPAVSQGHTPRIGDSNDRADRPKNSRRRRRRRIRRNPGRQSPAPAPRRRHHPGEPASGLRRADPPAPAGRRHRHRDRRLRHAARRRHPAGRRRRRPHRDRRPAGAADVGRRAGLRLPDLRRRQHRRDAGGARRSRIRAIRSPIWKARSGCAMRSPTCRRTLPSPSSAAD